MKEQVRLLRLTLKVQSGFTLVELVVIIAVLGIISVMAMSRMDDGSGYNEYLLQKRLLSALRHVQMQAMHDTRDDYCYRLNFNYSSGSQNFGPPVANVSQATASGSCASSIDFTAPDFLHTRTGELSGMGVTLSGSDGSAGTPLYIGFNHVGRPLTAGALCRSGIGCQFSFTGESTVSVCINAEGFIHEC